MNKRSIFLLFFLFLPRIATAQESTSLFEQAMFSYAQREYAAAYQKFRAYLAEFADPSPRMASAQFYAAECLFHSGDFPGAIYEYEKVVSANRLSNFREEALHQLGVLYLNAERPALAREHLTALLNEYPESRFGSSALSLISKCFAAGKEYEAAREFYEAIIKQKKHPALLDYTVFNLAGIHEKTENYKKAAELYEYILTYFTNSPLYYNAQTRLGYCFYYLKEYESSIIELSNPSLKTLPVEKQVEALYMLGNSMYRTKNYKEAATIFTEIINAFPQSSFIRTVRYSLGWSHFQLAEYDQALKIFDALSKENAQDTIRALALYWKGETYRYLGSDNEALKIFQDFLRRYPDTELAKNIHYQAAIIYYNNKMYDKAILFLTEGTKKTEGELQARCYALLGELELNRRNYPQAQSHFMMIMNQKMLSDADTSHQYLREEIKNRALLGLGMAAFYQKQYDQAVTFLENLARRSSSFEQDKVNFYRAECEFSQKKFGEALRHYAAVPKQNQALYSSAVYGIAYCHYNMKNYDDAGYVFEDFLKLNPDEQKLNDARIRLADTYFASKKYANAAKLYEGLIKSGKTAKDKEYLSFQYSLSLYKSGKTANAISEFNRIAKTYPSTAHAENALYMIGWIAFQQNKFQEAISSYRKIFSQYKNPKNAPLVYYSIGDAYYNLGAYDSATANYTMIIERFPASQYVYDAVNGIQLCYSAMGKTDDAVATIDRFLQQNPASPLADQLVYQKGDLFYNLGDYQRAINEYQQFVRNYPSSKLVPKALFATGKCLQYSGSPAAAAEFFRQVFEQYTTGEDALSAVIEWGKLLSAQKDFDGALAVYDKALTKLKDEKAKAEILYYKGINLTAKGDTPAAYDVFDDVVVYHSGSIFADKAKLELGIIELRAKRFANAAKFFQALLADHTDEIGAAAQYYSGMMYKEQGKYTDAITAFVRVVNTYSSYVDWTARSYYLIGECYEALKDLTKAREMYKIVLERFPQSEPAPFAAKKLEGLQ